MSLYYSVCELVLNLPLELNWNCIFEHHALCKFDFLQYATQVELVKITGQQFSTAHLLEVYRGSLSQFVCPIPDVEDYFHLSLNCKQFISLFWHNQVKKHRHETLSLHGAGKHLAKGEASRVLRHLVTEDILSEDVKKSDIYGSVSSVVKVSMSCFFFGE